VKLLFEKGKDNVMNQEKLAIRVQLATPENASALGYLLSLFEGETISSAQVLERLSTTQAIETPYLAYAGERVVGLACLRLVPALSLATLEAAVTELYVDREYQGEEVEGLLLEAVEKQARQQGAAYLTLNTGVKNTNAQIIYRGLGYQGYALVMRKRIQEVS
jgi:ribosomal protein S18 acetylase RimI-like enzyme